MRSIRGCSPLLLFVLQVLSNFDELLKEFDNKRREFSRPRAYISLPLGESILKFAYLSLLAPSLPPFIQFPSSPLSRIIRRHSPFPFAISRA